MRLEDVLISSQTCVDGILIQNPQTCTPGPSLLCIVIKLQDRLRSLKLRCGVFPTCHMQLRSVKVALSMEFSISVRWT